MVVLLLLLLLLLLLVLTTGVSQTNERFRLRGWRKGCGEMGGEEVSEEGWKRERESRGRLSSTCNM